MIFGITKDDVNAVFKESIDGFKKAWDCINNNRIDEIEGYLKSLLESWHQKTMELLEKQKSEYDEKMNKLETEIQQLRRQNFELTEKLLHGEKKS